MKYLKKFNEEAMPTIITDEEMKEIMTPVINWKLIEELKYQSLEFLDDGFELVSYVDQHYNYITSVVRFEFGHDKNEEEWYDKNSNSSIPSKDKIPGLKLSYRFALIKDDSFHRTTTKVGFDDYDDYYYIKESRKLLKEITAFFPDEEIDIFTTDNF